MLTYYKYICLLPLYFLVSCSSYDVFELHKAPCDKLKINYIPQKAAIAITDGQYTDTVATGEIAFTNYLIKLRACEGLISENTNSGSFYKSNYCYLPECKEDFLKLKNNTDSVLMDKTFPTICDCDFSVTKTDSLIAPCFKKFQLHLLTVIEQETYRIKYLYYTDKCKGKISDSIDFTTYTKYYRDYNTNAANAYNSKQRAKDSADNSGPSVRCTYQMRAMDYQGNQKRYTEQCKNYTNHKSGKCNQHR